MPHTPSFLLAPGPVPIPQSVRDSLALPARHHRTESFKDLLNKTLSQISQVFETQQPSFILSSTGSGAMEAAIVNTHQKGDKVLVLSSGKFGQRWAQICRAYDLETLELEIPWGQTISPETLSKKLKTNPDIKSILTQHCETSTGVLHSLETISQLRNQLTPDALVIVDGITAVGACPLSMDQWEIDILIGGSQKAFMLPTGLAFISLSEKAWERQKKSDLPKFYFDLKKELAANQKSQTFFSSPVHLIQALSLSLNLILKEGLPTHLDKIKHRSQAFRKALEILDFEFFPQSPSPSLSALTVPDGIDGELWKNQLHQQGYIVMGGQDQLKGQILRVGHMGALEEPVLLQLIEVLYTSRQKLLKKSIDSETLAQAIKIHQQIWKG